MKKLKKSKSTYFATFDKYDDGQKRRKMKPIEKQKYSAIILDD